MGSRVGALALLAALAPAGAAEAQFTKPYRLERLDERVFAIIWEDMTAYPFEGNHLVIEGEADVIVVDANRTPALADTVIAIVRRETGKPVSHVINTHWHADHVQGNSAYLRRFPDVEIVGHPETVAGIDSILVPYVDEVRREVAEVRARLASPDEFGEEERVRVERERESLEREELLYSVVELATPTRLVSDSLIIERGGPRIEVLHLGAENTPGDLVVWLPGPRIAAVGDLVTRPYPFLGWDSPGSWARVLNDVLGRDPRAVVPGHGEVLHSMEYAILFRDVMRSVSHQVQAGLAAGEDPEGLSAVIDLVEYWEAFADGDQTRVMTFFVERLQPVLVERAVLELRAP